MTKVANWPPLSCFTLYLPSFFPAFAGDGAVTDVVAVETAVPADFLSQAIGLLLSFFNRTTDGGGAEYAATCGDDLTVLQSGTRMEHFAFQLRGSIQTFDHIALGVIGRITTSGDHHTHGWAWVPGGFDLVQRLGQCGFDQQHQGRLQAAHDRLGFRVAEAAVELNDLGLAGLVDHQPGVEETGVDVAFAGHTAHGRVDHFVHYALVHIDGDHRGWRVSAHAAGVRAGIGVTDALVVLAGGHRQHVLAVDHDDKGGFFTAQKLFNDHARTRVTESVASEHVAYGVFGFGQGHGDDHAFARSQAVSLDHDRRADFLQVGQGRLDFGEVLVVGRWDVLACQEILGKGLGAFQLRSGGGGAEDIQLARTEQINHAFNQRRFRADDGQLHVLLGEIGQLLDGQNVDGDVLALGLNSGAGVAGGDEDFSDALVLGHFPGQGVFTTAAADDQYVHVALPVEAGVEPVWWISKTLSILQISRLRSGW